MDYTSALSIDFSLIYPELALLLAASRAESGANPRAKDRILANYLATIAGNRGSTLTENQRQALKLLVQAIRMSETPVPY